MRLKPFIISDLGSFIPNEFSNPDLVLEFLASNQCEVQTLWGDDDMVQAILCVKNYWGRNWMGFFLISKQFNPAALRTLKQAIDEGMRAHKALRLQTESVSTPELRAWHKLLGFEFEGMRKKMMFDRDYDMWAMTREEV